MPSGPLVVPSLRSGHYSLGAFGPLNPIETLESASNYYLELNNTLHAYSQAELLKANLLWAVF